MSSLFHTVYQTNANEGFIWKCNQTMASDQYLPLLTCFLIRGGGARLQRSLQQIPIKGNLFCGDQYLR